MTDVARLGTADRVLSVLPADAAPWSLGVIIRHTEPRQRRALAETLVPLCRRRKVVCVIAGDWSLAARLHADGLHLSEHGARFGAGAAARLWRRSKKRLLTIAAHGAAGIAKAVRLKSDAILLAPVFTTASHPDAVALGPVRFALLVRRAGRPVIALGGVTPVTASRLNGSGAAGLAGVGWATEKA